MKKTFNIYATDDRKPQEYNDKKMKAFSDFISMLSSRGKKFYCTPWNGSNGHETGLIVWYYM